MSQLRFFRNSCSASLLRLNLRLTVIQSMNVLGPAKAIMAIVISQTIVGYLIEVFGLFGTEKAAFSVTKLIGILVTIAGLILFKWEK